MALSDLAVYSEYAYTALTEVITQQIDLFNAASRGAIQLRSTAHQGDYSDSVFFAKVAGLVRRRNPYGSGAVSQKVLQHLVDTMVKVAAGTPPVNVSPSQFLWIQQNPQVAGAALGQQLAGDMLGDMLNTGIMGAVAALKGQASLNNDVSGSGAGLTTPVAMSNTVALFGDRGGEVAAWIMHSKPLYDMYANALTNTEKLFTYGTVNIIADAFGRILVVSDSPSLLDAGSPNKYSTLGLVPGALLVDQNNDFNDNWSTTNGDENIQRTYQAEWSYNLGVKGYAWDKTNGGKAPNDAAIATASNWDKIVTSLKDTAGVLLYTK